MNLLNKIRFSYTILFSVAKQRYYSREMKVKEASCPPLTTMDYVKSCLRTKPFYSSPGRVVISFFMHILHICDVSYLFCVSTNVQRAHVKVRGPRGVSSTVWGPQIDLSVCSKCLYPLGHRTSPSPLVLRQSFYVAQALSNPAAPASASRVLGWQMRAPHISLKELSLVTRCVQRGGKRPSALQAFIAQWLLRPCE